MIADSNHDSKPGHVVHLVTHRRGLHFRHENGNRTYAERTDNEDNPDYNSNFAGRTFVVTYKGNLKYFKSFVHEIDGE